MSDLPDNDDSPNPYAAPVSTAIPISNEEILVPPRPGRVIVKWLMVCSIAAGPSFFVAGGLGGWRLPEIGGMLFGVLIFTFGYSLLEFTPQIQSAMTERVKRRASRIAYISRMAISILFPVGVFFDMYCGLLAVGISSAITGQQWSGLGNGVDQPAIRFLWFLLTTLIQGVLLNILLFAYMLIVYGFLCAIGVKKSTVEDANERP